MRGLAHKKCPHCGSSETLLYTDNDAYEFLTRAYLKIDPNPDKIGAGDPGILTARNREIAFTGRRVDPNQLLKTVEQLAKVAAPFGPVVAKWLSDKLERVRKNRINEVLSCFNCGYVKIT